MHISIYPLIFAPRLRDNASDKKEVWVSGWNHQFAKLTYGITVPGVRIPLFPQKTGREDVRRGAGIREATAGRFAGRLSCFMFYAVPGREGVPCLPGQWAAHIVACLPEGRLAERQWNDWNGRIHVVLRYLTVAGGRVGRPVLWVQARTGLACGLAARFRCGLCFSGVGNQPYGGCGLPDRYGRALLFSVKLKFYRLFKSFTGFLPSYEWRP